jgi:histidyl-tRNA synthetase
LSAPKKIKAPRGTFDVLGEQAHARTTLEAHARTILEGAGYERIETPAFEATELFARGVGESTDIVRKEMFTFTDAGGRSLTLRPEGTAPVCRAYIEHGMHKRRQPVKLWYLSTFFRHERAQAGRYRQFWQVGAEALGADDPAVDAEAIVLLGALLEEVGVSQVRLRLSTLGSPERRGEYRELLAAHLRANSASLSEDVRARIDSNPMRAFDSEHEGTRSVIATAPVLIDHLDEDDLDHFAAVRELLEQARTPYELDPTLVRGLDYYTRTVFEFTSDALGAQSGVGGGGRYDRLIEQLGGTPAPAMGWAAGVERMLLAGGGARAGAAGAPDGARGAVRPLELFIVRGDGARAADDGAHTRVATTQAQRLSAFALLAEARSAGLIAQMELAGRSVKGALGHANSLGARFVAIVEGDHSTLRDMQDGGAEQIATDTVAHTALARLRTL